MMIIFKIKRWFNKNKYSYFKVRNNAWKFLIENNITSYPLNLRQIAKNNDWQIWSYKKYSKVFNIEEKMLVEQFPSGFTEIIEEKYVICYNELNSKQRNRFTICHEFGHIILHQVYKNKKLEREANMFAARILMPIILIKALNIQTIEELCELCCVSNQAATYRLKRYNELILRKKFLTNHLEREFYFLLKSFISQRRKNAL